jgi:molybdenum cofactor cytidylyltransferase
LDIVKAIRAGRSIRLALVGAGGKTTAMFQLARQLALPVLVSASTHLGVDQLSLADAHFVVDASLQLGEVKSRLVKGVNLFTGPIGEDNRTKGLAEENLEDLRQLADELDCPLLVEADGSRGLPLKAPAAHEPPIPAWVNIVAILVGLSGLGKPLAAETIHRPEIFAELSGAELGKPVDMPAIIHLLLQSEGGLKNIPPDARKVVIFNQADTPYLQAEAAKAAVILWKSYHSVLVASLGHGQGVYAVYEPTAGIVLAGGKSERLGQPKALLDWNGQPFIRVVVQTAIAAGLTPVNVVVGAVVEPIREILKDLTVNIVENIQWQTGQSSSIRAGVKALPPQTGSAIFLLCDQPQIPTSLLSGLVEKHNQSLAAVVSPLVKGKRANPNLFDRDAFQDLLDLQGDVGGRAVFSKFLPEWLPWDDSSITLDVDTPEDYRRLLETGQAHA